ncbi:hypothetical protein [Photorhabdus hindustanensis]|uniref:Uncharacterized protein n=1 Tax=Photorhabdus hindustanensis TaxID=2918802 RepID=A0A2S8PTV6_9GAMM|nr:hypothetical protein [Photorhabdus hindustanensis]PQQ22214.1 hypothetical protein C6H66_24475 [Photorhabdus hindustanensis]
MLLTIRHYLIAASSIMDIMPSTNYKELALSVSDSEQIRNDIAAISDDATKVLLDAQEYIKENLDI